MILGFLPLKSNEEEFLLRDFLRDRCGCPRLHSSFFKVFITISWGDIGHINRMNLSHLPWKLISSENNHTRIFIQAMLIGTHLYLVRHCAVENVHCWLLCHFHMKNIGETLATLCWIKAKELKDKDLRMFPCFSPCPSSRCLRFQTPFDLYTTCKLELLSSVGRSV